MRRPRAAVWAGLVAGFLVTVPTATVCAQGAAPAPAASSEDRTEEAKGLFNAGKAAFDAGRYPDALDYFERSYAISGRAGLLYNVALASDRARDDEKALAAYERYLAAVPDAGNREEVENRIAALRTAIERRRATAAPPTSTPAAASATPATAPAPHEEPEPEPDEPSDASRPSTLQWAALGASGAVAIVGGVLIGVALSDKSTVEDAADGTKLAEIQSAHDRVPTFSAIGSVFLGLGAAGVAATVAWIVTGGQESASTDTLSLRIGPTSVVIGGAL